MVSTSIGPLFGRGGYLRGLWLSISCPPISGSFNLEMAMECGQFPSLHISTFFFFFFGYGALGFPFCNYYLVAAWRALWPHVISRLVRRSLVLVKLFSFPRFLRRFLFKPLVFSLCTYFCKTPVILCLSAPNFQLPLDFTTVTSALISSPFQFRFLFQLPHFTFFFLF